MHRGTLPVRSKLRRWRLLTGSPWLLAAAAICFAPASYASIIATIQQSGSDVTISASGSVDLTGLHQVVINQPVSSGGWLGGLGGENGAYGAAVGAADVYIFGTLVVSGSWPNIGDIPGTGGVLVAQQNGASSNSLFLPAGYVSGSDITTLFAGFTMPGQSFASLGLTGGLSATYSWDAGAGGPQSVTILTVPEPTTALLFFSGLVGLAVHGRRSWA